MSKEGKLLAPLPHMQSFQHCSQFRNPFPLGVKRDISTGGVEPSVQGKEIHSNKGTGIMGGNL